MNIRRPEGGIQIIGRSYVSVIHLTNSVIFFKVVTESQQAVSSAAADDKSPC